MEIHEAPPGIFVGQGAGVDIQNSSSYYVRDLLVANESAVIRGRKAFAPEDVLLVVEVLSESNKRHDRVTKREDYAVEKIPAYWVVDPEAGALTALELGGGAEYHEQGVVRPGERWKSDWPFPLTLDPAEFLCGGLLDAREGSLGSPVMTTSGAVRPETRPSPTKPAGLAGLAGLAHRLPPRWVDVVAAALFVVGALWVTCRGWLHIYDGMLGSQPKDQVFNEWMLAYDAHAVSHLENPFFSTLQNAPDGVNLMGNVAMQLPGVLLAPVTLLGGAPLSYLLLITFNLAATAFAWYYVLSRHVVASRLAALLGGAFCGFAPGMIAHSNGHPHITAQFLVPFIVWRVARLREPGRAVRNGLALGSLLAAQFFVGEEILLLTAVGCAVAALAYVLSRPRQARQEALTFLAGLGVAAGLVLLVAAYPMWVQFFGPQHYHGAPDSYPADLASYPAFGREALAGSAAGAKGLAPNPTEETAFVGWPLLIVALVAAALLWRNLVARTAAVTAAVLGVLSLGPTIVYNGHDTGVPGPYALLDGLPVLDAMIVSRFALVVAAAFGVLLAVAADRALTLPRTGRAVAIAAIVAALIPIAPTPLQAANRPDVPRFITSGQWRKFVAPERTLVPVPVEGRTGLRWATVADLGFAVPQGYFLGPTGPDDDTGRWSAPTRPTWRLLQQVAAGRAVAVTGRERAQARVDVAFWRADVVVLDDRAPRAAALRQTLDTLFGPGQQVADVHVYPVRA